MKMRLMGQKKELDLYIEGLKQNGKDLIIEISDYYKNRGESKLYRCYIEVTLPGLMPITLDHRQHR